MSRGERWEMEWETWHERVWDEEPAMKTVED